MIRVGFLGVAHMHAYGYLAGLRADGRAELVGAYDHNSDRAQAFAANSNLATCNRSEALLGQVDAVVISSENVYHGELAVQAARANKSILCEKPLVISEEQAQELFETLDQTKAKLMTAFPCRYSPAYRRLNERVSAGDIGAVKAICATNRGTCPFDWFTDTKLSGGGAMIDHVVHVADLLRDLLQDEVVSVQAQTGNNMYGQEWEDTAMLTLEFVGGVFASLDSSWSRPKSFKTWGDVTMNVVGESGVIELDMFGQEMQVYSNESMRHTTAGWGSDLDGLLVKDFLDCIEQDRAPSITARDGWEAARIALAGYESASTGRAVRLDHLTPASI